MNINKIANGLLNNKYLNKVVSNAEYDNFNMSLPSMLLTLYGATLIPRYIHAYDEHDRKEILTRDLTTITSILFGSRALKKVISKISTNSTGLALAIKPSIKHNTWYQKMFNYLRPVKGVQVLNSENITSIYSQLDRKTNGIEKLFQFNDKNGGKLSKMLLLDKNVKEASEKILKKTLTKEISNNEIIKAFEKARNSVELEKIYKIFDNPKNSFVRKAKGVNSTFDFISTLVIIPLGMIALQKYNQNKTQKRIDAQIKKTKEQENKLTSVENMSIKRADKFEKQDLFNMQTFYSAKNSSTKDKAQVFAQFINS